MKLDQRTATIIMQEGWGKAFDFQMEDKHAYYFKSDEQEMKLIKNYGESGFFFVEGRDHGQEDWLGWDTVSYDEVATMIATVSARERYLKQQKEITV